MWQFVSQIPSDIIWIWKQQINKRINEWILITKFEYIKINRLKVIVH